MQKVRYSLIVPIYNVKPYLDRCIESLLKQERDDYEILLVDDGSTDGSGIVADSYAKKYPFVSCIHKENGGLSSARNKGLEYATGEYILFVDSDDWIDTNALSILDERMGNAKPDIVKFNYVRMPANDKIFSTAKPGMYNKKEIEKILLPNALEKTGEFIFSAWSYAYKKDLIDQSSISFVSERLVGSEDYLFNSTIFLHAKSILIIDDMLYFYDYREGSLTGRYRPKLISQYFKLQEELCKTCDSVGKLEEYEHILKKSFVWRCFSTCVRNEMTITNEHSFWEGYFNCKKMFSSMPFKDSIRGIDYSREPYGIKVRFILMKANLIFPLVYSQYLSNKK